MTEGQPQSNYMRGKIFPMSDVTEAADVKIAEAKERLWSEVKTWITPRSMTAQPPHSVIRAALAVHDAEAELAALNKPRLLTPNERLKAEGFTESTYLKLVVERDRADILAQAEKLPRHIFNRSREGLENMETIALSDLAELLKT